MVKSDKTKDNSATKVLAPGAIGSIESVPKERAQFRAARREPELLWESGDRTVLACSRD